MDYISDEHIPCEKAENPILDSLAEERLLKAASLHIPSTPVNVIGRAQLAASGTGVAFMLLVGLVVRVQSNLTIRIKPAMLKQVGLSEGQSRRAATALAKAGLIQVLSTSGKRREITLCDSEYIAWLTRNSPTLGKTRDRV